MQNNMLNPFQDRPFMYFVALALIVAGATFFIRSAQAGFTDTEGGGAAGTILTVSALFGIYFMLPGIFALPVMLYKHASFINISWVFFLAFWPIACLAGVLFGQALLARNWAQLALCALCPLVQVGWFIRLLVYRA